MKKTTLKRWYNLIHLTGILIIVPNHLFATVPEGIYVVETKNTMMVFSGHPDGKFLFQYYGIKFDDVSQVEKSGIGVRSEAYPTFGIDCRDKEALRVTHADGNMSVDLYLKSVETTPIDSNISLTKVSLYDNKYPFSVNLYYKTYFKEDVIEAWIDVSHQEKGAVTLYKFASVYLPVRSFDPWLTHFHGNWANEFNMVEEKLDWGLKTIENREGIRNTQTDNPSVMLSPDGKPSEDEGNLIAGTLAWTGNYKIALDVGQKNRVNLIAGINKEASQRVLEKGEVFQTPAFVFTFSHDGKGEASRNIQRWARNYAIIDGKKERAVLLNSWEGAYFNVSEDKMLGMIDDIAALGGELFVMDDGWFGRKYPRLDETTSLGDWQVNLQKLPNGLTPLINRAKEKGIKFGIWLEPEMVNVKSELFEKHPDWVIHQPNRETVLGRGGSQMTLDMANPSVQDYVFNTIHDLLVQSPGIGYIKWDANHYISNLGSVALPAERQSHLYIDYHRGLQKTLQRIREAHPDLIMQACASGGGRVSYGYLKYFHEFWTSDNTDALSRLYMQWGVSHFFPAINMASHVSASPNHQSGRMIPLKFRFDVAMTGRLGMEMQPKDLSAAELEFSKKGIETYKSIRPVVQFGDLYRLVSPYDKSGMASLMYVSEDQNRAVLFAFNLDESLTYRYPGIRLKGLDAAKKYRLTEINRSNQFGNLPFENQVFTGEFLMKAGIQVNMWKALQSVVVELKEVN
jgi:alpha-galactosidase